MCQLEGEWSYITGVRRVLEVQLPPTQEITITRLPRGYTSNVGRNGETLQNLEFDKPITPHWLNIANVSIFEANNWAYYDSLSNFPEQIFRFFIRSMVFLPLTSKNYPCRQCPTLHNFYAKPIFFQSQTSQVP